MSGRGRVGSPTSIERLKPKGKPKKKRRSSVGMIPKASPVTIMRRDGSQEMRPSYTRAQAAAIIRQSAKRSSTNTKWKGPRKPDG